MSPRWAVRMLGLARLAASTQVLARGRSTALKSAVGLGGHHRAEASNRLQSGGGTHARTGWGRVDRPPTGPGGRAHAIAIGGRRTLLPQPRGRGPGGAVRSRASSAEGGLTARPTPFGVLPSTEWSPRPDRRGSRQALGAGKLGMGPGLLRAPEVMGNVGWTTWLRGAAGGPGWGWADWAGDAGRG